MPRSILIGAVVVICWSGVCGARQAGSQAALSDPLRAHVKNEPLGVVTAMRGLPLGVREALQGLFGAMGLDIADPGAPFQGSVTNPDISMPSRRLVAAGRSVDHCVVYYERAGTARTWHLALFHWTPEETRLEAGGLAASGLKTVEDLRAALLSGAFKDPNKVW